MIIFELEGYQVKMDDWAKHHKELGLHFKREYEDGEVIEINDELLDDIIENNKDKVVKKNVELINKETKNIRLATDYLIPLYNANYKEVNSDSISLGVTDRYVLTSIRFTFKVNELYFILDYDYVSDGNYPVKLIEQIKYLKDIIEGVASNDLPFEEKGIMFSKKNCEDRKLFLTGLDEYKIPGEIEVSMNELMNSLIAAEIYKGNEVF